MSRIVARPIGGSLVKLGHNVRLDFANPPTVDIQNKQFAITRNANNAYPDSAGQRFVTVYKFAKATKLKNRILSLGGLDTGSGSGTYAAGNPGGLSVQEVWVRIRYFTNDVDVTTLTWANVVTSNTTLTIGGTIYERPIYRNTVNIPAGAFTYNCQYSNLTASLEAGGMWIAITEDISGAWGIIIDSKIYMSNTTNLNISTTLLSTIDMSSIAPANAVTMSTYPKIQNFKSWHKRKPG